MAKVFNSIAEIDAATTFAMWEHGRNYTDYTLGGSPADHCDAVSDGVAFTVQRLGTNTPSKLSPPQARYADQGAVRIDVSDGLLYRGAHADWSVDATVPTAYLLHFRVDSSDSTEQTIFSGLSGFGSEGWRLTVKGSGTGAGVKLYVMGTGSSVPSGSSAVCDGKEHTVLIVIDDANGRATLVTEWGAVTLTGLTYTQSGNLLCTIGPTHTGDTWTKTVSYLCDFKGKHANAYTSAAAIWALLDQDIKAKSLGAGAFAENESAEEVGTLADGSGAGASNGVDGDIGPDAYFRGGHTPEDDTHAGTYTATSAAVGFTGGFTAANDTHRGAFMCLKFKRVNHKQAALARVVWQLRAGYDENQADFIGGFTAADATHGGSYG